MSLHGHVALVTGSSRGLGLAIAKALHQSGAQIVINYIQSEASASQIADELHGMAIRADVTSLTQVQAMFEAARKHFGQPVGIVVNNALGDFQFNGDDRKKIEEIEWDDFDHQLRTSVQGSLNTTKAALEGFRELQGGKIINIGTNLMLNPVVPYQDYTTAKGALLAFTRTSAAELGPENVTVNMVTGGLLKVTDASKATPNEIFDQIASVTPLRRVTTPEDVAGVVVFLVGPLARQVTGQQLVVDGGLCMN